MRGELLYKCYNAPRPTYAGPQRQYTFYMRARPCVCVCAYIYINTRVGQRARTRTHTHARTRLQVAPAHGIERVDSDIALRELSRRRRRATRGQERERRRWWPAKGSCESRPAVSLPPLPGLHLRVYSYMLLRRRRPLFRRRRRRTPPAPPVTPPSPPTISLACANRSPVDQYGVAAAAAAVSRGCAAAVVWLTIRRGIVHTGQFAPSGWKRQTRVHHRALFPTKVP